MKTSTSTYRALTPKYRNWLQEEFGHVVRDKDICAMAWQMRNPDITRKDKLARRWPILKLMQANKVAVGMELDFHIYLVFGVSNEEASGKAMPWDAA